MQFAGVKAIYVDKVEVEHAYYEGGAGVLYLDARRRLVSPPPGHERVRLAPVYESRPSDVEVRALIERYRMVKEDLPHVVVISRMVHLLDGRRKSSMAPHAREVEVGYNVLLRGREVA